MTLCTTLPYNDAHHMSDLPVLPDTPGIVLCSGRWMTESGELPHAPIAPNIASAMPSTAGVVPTATAVDPPQRGIEDNRLIDSPPRNDEDDGFVVALAVTGMQTAPPVELWLLTESPQGQVLAMKRLWGV